MGTKTLNISIPSDMAGFLDENPDLSPSKVFQGAITNIQNSLKHNPQLVKANKDIEAYQKVIRRLEEDLMKATDFIIERGLWKEYAK